MADPQMIVRVAASISDLKASLAEAKSAVDTAGESAKQAGESFKGMGESWVARVAEGMLLRDALREVLSVVKEIAIGVPEEAHALELLSLQTQIGVEDLQRLSAATSEFGVDSDQLGRAIYQLSRRIAGGDESVATAYHLMGMSLDEVRGKNAMDLFLTTERGLGTLQGSIRDTAAADLFGGRLGVSMGAFSTGVDEAMEKANSLNHIVGQDSVKALSDYAVEIERATKNVHAWAMEIEGGAAVVVNAAASGASKWDLFNAIVADTATSVLTWSNHASHLAGVLDDVNRKTQANTDVQLPNNKAHADAAVALDAHGQAAKFMAALELDAAKPLLAWQEDYLQHLKDIGQLDAKHAAGIGVTVDQLKNYTRQQELFNSTTEAAYEAANKYDELLTHMDKETFTLAMEHEKQWTTERMERLKLTNAAVLAEFDAQTKLNAEWGLNAAGAIKLQSSALDVLNQKLVELHANKLEGISQEKQEQVLMDEYTKTLLDEAEAQDKVAQSTDAVTASTTAATAATQAFRGSLVLGISTLAEFNSAVSTFYDKLAAQGNVGMLGASSGVGIPGSIGQPRQIQARDGGGDVNAGQPYYVGTGAQPELFVPESAGTMIPNGGAAGGSTTHVTNVYLDGRVIATVVNDHNTRSMKQSRQYPAA